MQDYVSKCLICQQTKHATIILTGLLHPLPIPEQFWEDIAMDFITDLPPSQGFTVIFVVVDRFSKYGHFFPLKVGFSSMKAAEVFFNNILKLHGFLNSTISDVDKIFTSKFWQHLFKTSGTMLAMSLVYHPQTDGQTEMLNKCLDQYLRCLTVDLPKTWSTMLTWVKFWYNSAFHNNIGMTPFKVVYDREAPTLIKYTPSVHDPTTVHDLLIAREEVMAQLKTNLAKAQVNMKKIC